MIQQIWILTSNQGKPWLHFLGSLLNIFGIKWSKVKPHFWLDDTIYLTTVIQQIWILPSNQGKPWLHFLGSLFNILGIKWSEVKPHLWLHNTIYLTTVIQQIWILPSNQGKPWLHFLRSLLNYTVRKSKKVGWWCNQSSWNLKTQIHKTWIVCVQVAQLVRARVRSKFIEGPSVKY